MWQGKMLTPVLWLQIQDHERQRLLEEEEVSGWEVGRPKGAIRAEHPTPPACAASPHACCPFQLPVVELTEHNPGVATGPHPGHLLLSHTSLLFRFLLWLGFPSSLQSSRVLSFRSHFLFFLGICQGETPVFLFQFLLRHPCFLGRLGMGTWPTGSRPSSSPIRLGSWCLRCPSPPVSRP